jgi:hypothetical protein
MTDEQIALARRAVACKGWRWMPGMVAIHPNCTTSRVLFGRGYTFLGAYRRELKTKTPSWWQGWSGQLQHGQHGYAGFEHCTPVPDLTDPATLGCLLALVREAWRDPKVHVLYVEGLYRWECADRHNVHGSGATEAEALIDALEYA